MIVHIERKVLINISRWLLLVFLLLVFSLFSPIANSCADPLSPQRDIIADGYYDDPPVYSHINVERHAAYKAAVLPLETFLRTIVEMTNDGHKTCTLNWLMRWAKGGAMLGIIKNEQAHFERKWILAGVAMTYAFVRGASTNEIRHTIDGWLISVAHEVQLHSIHRDFRNNHLYWDGLAVGATGAVTGNISYLNWSRQVFDTAMSHIQDDGSLLLEMSRGSRALSYHLFAAAPLVTLESILDVSSAKLEKLVTLCISGLNDPLIFLNQTKSIPQMFDADEADWLVIFGRHHPSYVIPPNITNPRPYHYRLGGDLSKANPLEHPVKLNN